MEETTLRVTEAAKKLRALKREKEALDTQIKALEDEIKGIMDSTSTYEFIGDDWKITWNLVESTRFDQTLFKSQNPDLFSKYQSVSASRRFLLS